ncbi:catalase [Chitinimonas sp. PSY-7]|uniref:catalase n=1 Tax=Chitinimonas sp. PSY-7 TaxID=3459088 RepID=UPI00403FDB3C
MSKNNLDGDAKDADLASFREVATDTLLTTDQGVRINDDQHSLKAGDRGPTLLEDFILREKITHFDHERIPERVVHARGAAAHGYFQVYESQAHLTSAAFLQDPAVKTPVFTRFSTVAGSRGSSDMARDVRGFAVKFYTQEGNYDLVGNNMPVFFIQDAIKFPDLIHAVKPEPHNEIPQAASAHDTFWDFISLMPESMHMIMWVMSDRALPRSLRMMEGFGVHTFRFVNSEGRSRFVKFHWKPLQGVYSVGWNEAQTLSGQDPDFHRRDLWEAIEAGDFPEWELGVQVVEPEDEQQFDFDLLDPTKLIPEELVPVQRIGKMVLDRNPDNFFAETEQVAYHVGNVVPGIDLTNDPLLQGRLFSYTDTQLIRLGGPNSHEIPINRPIAPLHNLQRDGYMRQGINKGRVSYSPNTLGGGCPMQAGREAGGFVTQAEPILAQKVRGKSEKFFDHFSQAAMFFHSQADWEQRHIVKALQFELGKLTVASVRERMLGMLAQVDKALAARVAVGLGIGVPTHMPLPLNLSVPADADPADFQPHLVNLAIEPSPALSMANQPAASGIKTRQVAILAADGVDEVALDLVQQALAAAGARSKVLAPRGGSLIGSLGRKIDVDQSFLSSSSALFDAVYVPGGADSLAALLKEPEAQYFLLEAYRHCKTLVATGDGCVLIETACPAIKGTVGGAAEGVILERGAATSAVAEAFIAAIAQHRHWSREL